MSETCVDQSGNVIPPASKWHGFHRFADFVKASAALTLMICGGIYALLTWAFDDRYAAKQTEVSVRENEAALRQVNSKLTTITNKIDDSQNERARERIWELGIDFCEAGSQEARNLYQREIDDVRDSYAERTKRPAPKPPACEPEEID